MLPQSRQIIVLSSDFFESIGIDNKIYRILHCGDFRVNMKILNHPILRPFSLTHSKNNLLQLIDKVYLDTTYMSPKHNLPKQELVCEIMANLFQDLIQQERNKDEQNKRPVIYFQIGLEISLNQE